MTVSDLIAAAVMFAENPSLLPLRANSDPWIVTVVAVFAVARTPFWLPVNRLPRIVTAPPCTSTPAPVPSALRMFVNANPSIVASVVSVSKAFAGAVETVLVIVTSPPTATRLSFTRAVVKSLV